MDWVGADMPIINPIRKEDFEYDGVNFTLAEYSDGERIVWNYTLSGTEEQYWVKVGVGSKEMAAHTILLRYKEWSNRSPKHLPVGGLSRR